jgi:hypothetical protein
VRGSYEYRLDYDGRGNGINVLHNAYVGAATAIGKINDWFEDWGFSNQYDGPVIFNEKLQEFVSANEIVNLGNPNQRPEYVQRAKNAISASKNTNGGRPEWDLDNDGKMSFGEADGWYKWGKGQPVHARLDKIDLSSVSVSDFKNPDFFKEGKPGIYVRFDGDDYVNRNQALVYGTISLVLVTGNIVMSLGDTYDFDIKNQPGTFKRDVATILGQHYAGWGTAFPIHITGTSKIGR